ncbi:Photosystem I PsaA/PsaB [Dillenia turbinata]|uniref:Photosystem I PsaA/PsaB n=1 Tax=Dillenia turbinata TaxID=194707 RepID=A0AAN8UVN2_9MAGN
MNLKEALIKLNKYSIAKNFVLQSKHHLVQGPMGDKHHCREGIVSQEICNGNASGDFQGVQITTGSFQIWRASGITSELQLYSTVFGALIFAMSIKPQGLQLPKIQLHQKLGKKGIYLELDPWPIVAMASNHFTFFDQRHKLETVLIGIRIPWCSYISSKAANGSSPS